MPLSSDTPQSAYPHPALDPSTPKPVPAAPSIAYLKPLVHDHPKIEAGDYTYIHSFDDPARFADRLLALQWWDWPIGTIRAASHALMQADVTALEKHAPQP